MGRQDKDCEDITALFDILSSLLVISHWGWWRWLTRLEIFSLPQNECSIPRFKLAIVVIVTMISLYCDGRCHPPIVLVGPVIVTVAVLVTVMVLIVEMVSSVSWFKSRWFFCNDPSKVWRSTRSDLSGFSLVTTRGFVPTFDFLPVKVSKMFLIRNSCKWVLIWRRGWILNLVIMVRIGCCCQNCDVKLSNFTALIMQARGRSDNHRT